MGFRDVQLLVEGNNVAKNVSGRAHRRSSGSPRMQLYGWVGRRM
jgi:hypothetical protein